MSLNIGFDAQAPSLPQGGGAISGLGETFTPDLSTGTGTFTVKIDCPNGPNDIGPRLILRYDTGEGNGPFGMGFSIPLPRIIRSAVRGYPHYDDGDVLILEGAGELIPLGGGKYRPQVDGGVWRVESAGDGFRLTDSEGLYYYLGTSSDARLVDEASRSKDVFAWHLERIEDALGNSATFKWMRNENQLYLLSIVYDTYEVRLNYQSRPDVVRYGRAGFLISTTLRCKAIELLLPSSSQPLLRRWSLSYDQDESNGCSLLTSIVLSGFGDDSSALDAPPLKLGYSTFKVRELTRFKNMDQGTAPGPLSRSDRRVEIVDWYSRGLPDLLEISPGGRARVWPNLGDCTWGRPESVGDLPLFAYPSASIGLIDMNGDGAADLVRVDRPLDGYIPRIPGGGFGRPVNWHHAPSMLATDRNVRLVDLDGDGLVDILASSGDYLELFYRSEPDGWAGRPQVILRGEAPVLNLADAHVFLADMTGDGSDDIVRVDGRGITYWPYLGMGKWGRPVIMSNPPNFPFNLRPESLFLSDIDGDGCADLIYLAEDRVMYWINQAGSSFSDMREVRYVPTGQITEVRMADMRGNGTPGLLWSTGGLPGHGAIYFFLDFCGESKPHLLNSIDNGLGLRSEIYYTTSSQQAAADAREGKPWGTSLPIPVPVVEKVTTRDESTGRTSITTYRYHDGRYDGLLREFAGFGRVDEEQMGDTVAPTLRTTTWFHIGIDLGQPDIQITREERRSLRAIRGRIYRQEHYGLDGSQIQNVPYDRLDQEWNVNSQSTVGGTVYIPYLVITARHTLERSGPPATSIITVNKAWDKNGNITDSVQTAVSQSPAVQSHSLETITTFAEDPAGRFLSKAWRVKQLDGSGAVVADSITQFDELPEGKVGAQGLVTKRSALVLTDAMVDDIYGSEVPDFASLGYYRRPGEIGWWIDQASYHRTDDANGLHGQITGPRGSVTMLEFDVNKTYPVRITDPRRNETNAEYDYRSSRVKKLTDASGAVYTASFDALARPLAIIEPGDNQTLPTTYYEYLTSQLPVEVNIHKRASSGAALTIDSRNIYDGTGLLIESRVSDDLGEIITSSHLYSSRGFLARTYLEHLAGSVAYSKPDTGPYVEFTYDALGRLISARNPDGSHRILNYSPLLIEEWDEEDTLTGPVAGHANTPTRRSLDPTGRIEAIEENLGGRWIRSTYEYDVKGNLISHTDPLGNVVRIWYDLLGRTLRVERTEQGTVTVLDAAGNSVIARGRGGNTVLREFDECNRPVAVRYGAGAKDPVVRFVYHDTGVLAPSEAGAHTSGGRVVRIDDEGGTTIFDYDQRGRLALKRSQPAGSAVSYDLNFNYRSDGHVESIIYPDTGSGRITLSYEYNKQGKMVRIPGLIDQIDYNLAGQRAGLKYVNGTEQKFSYDQASRRLTDIRLDGPGGVLLSMHYTMDLAGNLLRIDSQDQKLAATYVYDDLYRLIEAHSGSGQSWNYRYDDAGNITFKSDKGDYHYGENGAPANCLTSAGADAFTYTPMGEMKDTPWGTQAFDPMGRLIRISGSGANATQMEFKYDYSGARVAARKIVNNSPEYDILTPDKLYSVESGVLVLHLFDGQRVIADQSSGGRRFMHYDHLGGLAVVTDSSGNVLDSLRYDPYGSVIDHISTTAMASIGFAGGRPDEWSGLLFFNARYYHPGLGRFISSDAVVQSAYDPISWSAYVYCRDNPASYVDPSGRSFWGIFLAAVAIVALVVVSVVTFGLTTPLLVVGIGLVAGGVVGGLAAANKGGSFEDILTGVLVGAAVGGWAAFASVYAGAALSAKLGIEGSIWGGIVAGGVNGAINGAAMGFASGFAGGKGSIDDILKQMLQGAVVGLVVGAALGALSYSKPPEKSLPDDLKDYGSQWTKPTTPSSPPATGQMPGAPNAPLVPSDPAVHSLSEAGSQIGTKVGGDVAGILAKHGIAAAAPALGSLVLQVAVVDVMAGAWDLYIKDELYKRNVNLGPFNFLSGSWG